MTTLPDLTLYWYTRHNQKFRTAQMKEKYRLLGGQNTKLKRVCISWADFKYESVEQMRDHVPVILNAQPSYLTSGYIV